MKNTMTKLKMLAVAGMTMGLAQGAQAENRSPDYAEKTGNDWMYNHAIAGKEYEGEAAESSVDLFYVYPTLTGGEIVIDGFRGIDDAAMRGDEVPSFVTAAGAFHGNARCFADMTHVYAPYYRQATLDTAFDCATNGLGGVRSDANQRYLTALFNGPAYTDVTNALETYFFKWNKGRKFMLAGHSQGSAILRLVMENYFQEPAHKAMLKNLVASYQIGYGVSKANMDEITKKTGVTFATTSNDVGVVVSYNLFGEGATGNSVLLPDDAIAINPLTWTTNTTPADKSLNLGAISQLTGEAIGAGLYGATVNAKRGTVECAEFPESAYVGKEVFGEKSLHGQDYPAFWENLRENNYVRGGKLAGFAKLSVPNLSEHVRMSGAKVDGADLTAIGGGYWAVTSAVSVATIVTPKDENPKVVFVNGEREMALAMKYEDGVWVTVMSEAEIAAAMRSSDTPKVQLGVVAQRYPWNGMLDVEYKTPYANASVNVTFYANGIELGTAQGTGGQSATASFDLNAIDEFKDKQHKSVKITATLE